MKSGGTVAVQHEW
jgi:hypothetical protein